MKKHERPPIEERTGKLPSGAGQAAPVGHIRVIGVPTRPRRQSPRRGYGAVGGASRWP